MIILFTLRVFARILLRENRRRNTFCILFWCLAWGSNSTFTSNKPTHYRLGYGDFHIYYISILHTYFNIMQPLFICKVWNTLHTHIAQHVWCYCFGLYITHKISMKRLWTLKYLPEGCMFALLAAFYF